MWMDHLLLYLHNTRMVCHPSPSVCLFLALKPSPLVSPVTLEDNDSVLAVANLQGTAFLQLRRSPILSTDAVLVVGIISHYDCAKPAQNNPISFGLSSVTKGFYPGLLVLFQIACCVVNKRHSLEITIRPTFVSCHDQTQYAVLTVGIYFPGGWYCCLFLVGWAATRYKPRHQYTSATVAVINVVVVAVLVLVGFVEYPQTTFFSKSLFATPSLRIWYVLFIIFFWCRLTSRGIIAAQPVGVGNDTMSPTC